MKKNRADPLRPRGHLPQIGEHDLGEENKEARLPNPIAVQNLFNRYFEWLDEQTPPLTLPIGSASDGEGENLTVEEKGDDDV